MGYHQKKKT